MIVEFFSKRFKINGKCLKNLGAKSLNFERKVTICQKLCNFKNNAMCFSNTTLILNKQ